MLLITIVYYLHVWSNETSYLLEGTPSNDNNALLKTSESRASTKDTSCNIILITSYYIEFIWFNRYLILI